MKKTMVHIKSLILCALVMIYCEGCQKTTLEERVAVSQIQRMLTKGFPPPSQIRAQLALAQWQNGKLDPDPVLIDARLVTPKGKQYRVLFLAISDEDGDVLGIGIKERKLSPDGKEIETFEEKYPIYEHGSPMKVSYEIIPVEIRTTNQRKDEELWKEYINEHKSTHKTPPPIWISLPRPGEIEVQLWLYDRAGRESQLVELNTFEPN